ILNENADLTDSAIILDLEKNEAGKITTISNQELFSSARGLAILRKQITESETHFSVESGKRVIGLQISELNHKR
ncbi:MAG: hypothetical protein WC061_03720, partial [Melioribacteraceae bacterium]